MICDFGFVLISGFVILGRGRGARSGGFGCKKKTRLLNGPGLGNEYQPKGRVRV